MDGISLAAHFRGENVPAREAIFWHYPHYHSAGIGGPAGAVRMGDWKLIEYYETTLTGQGAPTELFNLGDDPGETRNLAEKDPKRVAALKTKLEAWRKSVGAQMPTVNPDYDPAKRKDK
jgi:arylsulfatase A-like enzyme